MTASPQLHQIIESLIFASPEGISTGQLVRTLKRSAQPPEDEADEAAWTGEAGDSEARGSSVSVEAHRGVAASEEEALTESLRNQLWTLKETLALEEASFAILADHLGPHEGGLAIEEEYVGPLTARLQFSEEQREAFLTLVQRVEAFPQPAESEPTEQAAPGPDLNEPESAEALETVAEAAPQIDWARMTEVQVRRAIDSLNAHYTETGRAFFLQERAQGWRIVTRPDYADWIRFLFPETRPHRLSPATMETLAIIAYRQPLTKAAIEAIRGVSIEGPLQKLLDHQLIRIAGRAELPGRPLLYTTTEFFLEHFGLKGMEELPNAAELRKVPLPSASGEASASGAADASTPRSLPV